MRLRKPGTHAGLFISLDWVFFAFLCVLHASQRLVWIGGLALLLTTATTAAFYCTISRKLSYHFLGESDEGVGV